MSIQIKHVKNNTSQNINERVQSHGCHTAKLFNKRKLVTKNNKKDVLRLLVSLQKKRHSDTKQSCITYREF